MEIDTGGTIPHGITAGIGGSPSSVTLNVIVQGVSSTNSSMSLAWDSILGILSSSTIDDES